MRQPRQGILLSSQVQTNGLGDRGVVTCVDRFHVSMVFNDRELWDESQAKLGVSGYLRWAQEKYSETPI